MCLEQLRRCIFEDLFITLKNIEREEKVISDRKLKVIIFDFDGTLINSSKGILQAITHVIKTNGYSVKNGLDLYQFIGPPLKEQLKIACEITDEEADKANNEFVEFYEKNCLNMFYMYDGVKFTLEQLKTKGVKLYLATYKPLNQTKSMLEVAGIEGFFSGLSCSSCDGRKKKSELIFENVQNSQSNIEDCVYIGDTYGDEKAAKELGMQFVAAEYGFGQFESSVTKIKHIKDILEWRTL